MSIMFHVLDTGDKKVLVGPESNGFIGKEIKFIEIFQWQSLLQTGSAIAVRRTKTCRERCGETGS